MVPREIHSALVTGGSGYIGAIVTDFLERSVALAQVWSYGSAGLDVTDRTAVAERIRALKPDVIFHLAAKAETDWCEDNFEEAKRVNVDGALNVVEEGLTHGAQVVYFSSACLYPDNARFYAEHDAMQAFCRYTETKLLAEQKLKPCSDEILIIRMRQPFSNHRHRRNLLEKLASYSEFIDEPNSMSHLEECVPVIWELCRMGEAGPYNLTNEGWTTPLKIAHLIKRYWQPDMEIEAIGYEELLAKLRARRVNSLVDCAKLKAKGFVLTPVEDAVADCLENPCELGEYDWSRSVP